MAQQREEEPPLSDPSRADDLPVGTNLFWRLQSLIQSGCLAPRDRLPGVREFAAGAGVNVNTRPERPTAGSRARASPSRSRASAHSSLHTPRCHRDMWSDECAEALRPHAEAGLSGGARSGGYTSSPLPPRRLCAHPAAGPSVRGIRSGSGTAVARKISCPQASHPPATGRRAAAPPLAAVPLHTSTLSTNYCGCGTRRDLSASSSSKRASGSDSSSPKSSRRRPSRYRIVWGWRWSARAIAAALPRAGRRRAPSPPSAPGRAAVSSSSGASRALPRGARPGRPTRRAAAPAGGPRPRSSLLNRSRPPPPRAAPPRRATRRRRARPAARQVRGRR